ncbi:flagellar protein FlgN [Virgibacillus halodenitrificans]|uniref:flagellar protein FlgN n=1 Tax=Virgibacillus halodenitrificans TaxID=1482 RepID=UPI00045D3D31|nr:flagellar protein FlgN [Virgibacillus halodenitrificans]MCG1026843.1 flagellar protein FlgN [Virgibacillus halodenitrificans]MCJ0933010.1 flagellar protein FlgN [Virgibacillus halodenitrificans]MYL44675.1 flagellar protein FlgN [Virgibacillus halodenitrificans]CDQ30837.1 FlgN protein [Virgibacillus halodenitrificans]
MSVQLIIQSLHQLVDVHKQLLRLSNQKTEAIKEGSIDNMQKVIGQERKEIKQLEQAEKIREKLVSDWFIKNGFSQEDVSITFLLDHIEQLDEREKLGNITIRLTKLITELKQQEQLNQSLINQSMKFIQLSLDMLNPSIQNINYGNQQQYGKEAQKRSIFDSKA